MLKPLLSFVLLFFILTYLDLENSQFGWDIIQQLTGAFLKRVGDPLKIRGSSYIFSKSYIFLMTGAGYNI